MALEVSDKLAETLGVDHPYAVAAQMNAAICAHDAGEVAQALDLMRDAAQRLTNVLGPEHPHTLRCQANYALMQRDADGAAVSGDARAIIDRLARRIGDDHTTVIALRDGRMLSRIIDPHPF